MKSFIKISLLSCFLALVVSCSNGLSKSNENNNSKKEITQIVTITDGMKYLGDVNQVYGATSSRFMTGQVIKDFFGHEVEFEGNLVEYNSLKKEILDYVESLESNNALMHQNYYDVEYDATKKYVEVSSYTDTTSHQVVAYEIRVFFGNFLETFNTDFWYAKSSMFNASFTKDIQKNEKVNFGEPLIPEDEAEEIKYNSFSFEIPQDQDDKVCSELINAIGDADTIYAASNTKARFCTGQIVNWGRDTVRFQGNLVAYNSVNSKVESIFGKRKLDALCHQCYNDVTYDNSKTYIEVCYYENVETGKIVSYELRLVDDSFFTGSYTNWYAKSYNFNSLSDIQ